MHLTEQLKELGLSPEQTSKLLPVLNTVITEAVEANKPKVSKFKQLNESASRIIAAEKQSEDNIVKESIKQLNKSVETKVNQLVTESVQQLDGLVIASKADMILEGLTTILTLAGIDTLDLVNESKSGRDKLTSKISKLSKQLMAESKARKEAENLVSAYKATAKALVKDTKLLRENNYKITKELLISESKAKLSKVAGDTLEEKVEIFITESNNTDIKALKSHITQLTEQIMLKESKREQKIVLESSGFKPAKKQLTSNSNGLL